MMFMGFAGGWGGQGFAKSLSKGDCKLSHVNEMMTIVLGRGGKQELQHFGHSHMVHKLIVSRSLGLRSFYNSVRLYCL